MTLIVRLAIALIAVTISLAILSEGRAQSPSGEQVVIEGTTFELAKGLRVEKVAGQPLIKWPIVADWDSHGRLVVAESGGISRPIQEHNLQGVHKIVRLVDDDRDGEFDRRIVAAEDLGFPEGVLCIGNDILVSAPPVIWKLTDSDRDGVCENRQIWFDGKTVTNCANDLHGPYLGRDGWIYWCKGAFGEQTHSLIDGRTFQSSAAHIYRRRYTDGLIEPLISGGMDNPVEMAFIPEGEKFFTSTFLQHPGGGLRDGIAHAVYGGLYGKDHHVIDGHIRTGPLMPIMTQLGPAAPSGLICLESDRLVAHHNDQQTARFLCAASFNLHKVITHRLIPEGASFRTEDQDLLSTSRVDFHPTDVIEDADGSLLVLDTGGWYDLCCPTSRIDQTTAAGGIYRVSSDSTRADSVPAKNVDWKTLDLEGLCESLRDSRPWVRRQAGQLLQQVGNPAVKSLRPVLDDTDLSRDERLDTLWTLCQIGSSDAIAAVVEQLDASDPSIVQAACHVASIHRDANAIASLQQLLRHPSLPVRRAAAEAVGRSGDESSVEPLLSALEASNGDRHLDHSLLYALVEVTRRHPSVDLRELASSDRRLHAAILVLEQLGRGGELDPSQLFLAARRDDPQLRSAAIKALSSHPEWAAQSISHLTNLWSNVNSDSQQGDVLAEILAGWRDESSIAQLVGTWIASASTASAKQRLLVAANLHRLSAHRLWPEWSSALGDWMEQAEPDVQLILADQLGQLDLNDDTHATLTDRIVRLASEANEVPTRFRLLRSVPLKSRLAETEIEREVVSAFVDAKGKWTQLAADVLLQCRLSGPQAEHLLQSLPDVAPQHLMTAIEAVHRSGITDVEPAMLDQLREIPTARTLPRGFLTNLYKQAVPTLRQQADQTTNLLESPPEDIRRAVDEKLSQLGEGDPVNGLQVFRGERASCSGCHRMGYIGKEIGPDLTRIGRSRTAEALLEAILFPSARLEQSYQSTRVLTVDGQIHNGLLRSQDENSIELQLNAERKTLIPRDEIERMEPSDVSVMPQGIEQILSKQELADLLALLRSAQ